MSLTSPRWVLSFLLLSQGALAQNCVATINEIALRESLVIDTSFPRNYVLCEGTDFNIGTLDFDKNLINGQPMLPLKSNMKVQCGANGSRENGCHIRGGDVQVDGTDYYGVETREIKDVVLQGITFHNSTRHSVLMNMPGDIQFRDCEFRENRFAHSPVLLTYFDQQNRATELEVTFTDCTFDDNKNFGPPGQPALVIGNSRQNRLVFERNHFTNNDMLKNNTTPLRNSFLVESSGPITMIRNCFESNIVGVSPVVAYHPEQIFLQNYGFLSIGQVCPFVSSFETPEQFETFIPRCSDYDISGTNAVCPLDGSPAPTIAPTSAPTGPTMEPSAKPSHASMYPSLGPTVTSSPTETTAAPTEFPTFPPTEAPSFHPTKRPTLTPSNAPSPVEATMEPTVTKSMEPSLMPVRNAAEPPAYPPVDDPPVGVPTIDADEPTISPIMLKLTNPPTFDFSENSVRGDITSGSSMLSVGAVILLYSGILALL